MTKRKPTAYGINTLAAAVVSAVANADDIDALIFYTRQKYSTKDDVMVRKNTVVQLKKFRTASARYIERVEQAIASLPTETK